MLAAVIGLYCTGNTINVMTLAGLSLAIGPLVDSAIICLENTHRHLGLGATPKEAAFLRRQRSGDAGAGRQPCTLLVLAPLALMPGLGEFLFRPMALAVAFAMISAYFLSRSFVPAAVHALAQGRTASQAGRATTARTTSTAANTKSACAPRGVARPRRSPGGRR